MHTGMIWFDNSKKPLSAKIKTAVDYYVKKYNRAPDLVLVHPSMINGSPIEFEKLTVRAYRPVLPGHIWVGIEDKTETKG
jgi:hypothetical protein